MPKFIVVVCAFLNDCGFKKEKKEEKNDCANFNFVF